MAWEYRGEAGPYYTRSRRRNGRVVREYVGRGFPAEQVIRQDAEARASREAARSAIARERDSHEAARGSLQALKAQLDSLTSAAIEAAGYHQHHGQWRRRRSPAT
jgi:hypothetical protein